jgi:esterase/lipase superfamily enzyme
MVRRRSAIAIVACAWLIAGCATNNALMPTPALYTGDNARPLFSDRSIERRGPSLDLLFITDRAPAAEGAAVPYTAERSRSMAFGSTTIEFGDAVTWDTLIRESVAAHRSNPMHLALGPTRELTRDRRLL